MAWQFIIALIVAIPVILFPLVLMWYLNVGGVWQAARNSRRRKALRDRKAGATITPGQ